MLQGKGAHAMLFLLTGEVQTGKTRWLEGLAAELAERGVPVAGVLAPGQWVPSAGERADGNGYEKLGIDNVLLPGGRRIPFARRSDLARVAGTFDENSQAARAELAWHIADGAIAQVNAHFDELAQQVTSSSAPLHSARSAAGEPPLRHPERSAAGELPLRHPERSAAGAESKDPAQTPATSPAAPGLLIVDELGRLEICHGEGLTSAVHLLQQGPTPAFPHALVVVRDYLADAVEALLANAWPERARIAPSAAARIAVLNACQA